METGTCALYEHIDISCNFINGLYIAISITLSLTSFQHYTVSRTEEKVKERYYAVYYTYILHNTCR